MLQKKFGSSLKYKRLAAKTNLPKNEFYDWTVIECHLVTAFVIR